MNPELVWHRLTGCFLAGVLLGPSADLFRPLHRRLPVMTQLIIGTEFFLCWLYLGFGLCRGDLRMGYFGSAALGFLLFLIPSIIFLQTLCLYFIYSQKTSGEFSFVFLPM